MVGYFILLGKGLTIEIIIQFKFIIQFIVQFVIKTKSIGHWYILKKEINVKPSKLFLLNRLFSSL